MNGFLVQILAFFFLWRYARASFAFKPGKCAWRFAVAGICVVDILRTVFIAVMFHVAMSQIPAECIWDGMPLGLVWQFRIALPLSMIITTYENFWRLGEEICNLAGPSAAAWPALLHIVSCLLFAMRVVAVFLLKARVVEKIGWCMTFWLGDILLKAALGFD